MQGPQIAKSVTPPGTTPGSSAVDPRAEVDRLLERLQAHPADTAALEQLRRTAANWLQSEQLGEPGVSEKTGRCALAGWLSHLARGGRILHFGWREGSIGEALATAGASVTSFLDHPGRAILSALDHPETGVVFGTMQGLDDAPRELADLVVVETAGMETVVPLERAFNSVRAGGWIAVVGVPVMIDLCGVVEVGSFCFDPAYGVRPCVAERLETQLTLLRLAAPASRDHGLEDMLEQLFSQKVVPPTPLESLIRGRREQTPQELELQRRASGIKNLALPSQELIDWVGGGTPEDFESVGLRTAHQLLTFCDLQPSHRILEPGCGCGRNARALAPLLDPQQGSFEGFDVHEGAIDWATRTLTSEYPNIRFARADVRNGHYNPGGRTAAESFVFPYESNSFDIVFMPSVFTHMSRNAVQRYAEEIHRVLKPGGRLLSWHFLLDDESTDAVGQGRASIPFQAFDDVSWAQVPEDPCAAIAYDETFMLELYERIGLRPQAVIHGDWSGRTPDGYGDFQDRILAVKIDD